MPVLQGSIFVPTQIAKLILIQQVLALTYEIAVWPILVFHSLQLRVSLIEYP